LHQLTNKSSNRLEENMEEEESVEEARRRRKRKRWSWGRRRNREMRSPNGQPERMQDNGRHVDACRRW
jgi:hypothetical protein